MARTYFVSETYLKNNVAISKNVDPVMVMPFVQLAEELIMETILGSTFYDHLITGFTSQSLNTNEQLLVEEYIKPAEAWRSAEKSVVSASNQYTNKGLNSQNSDFSSSSSDKMVFYIREEWRQNAQFYENRLSKFLCLSGHTYPQYINQKDALTKPQTIKGFDSGLLFY